MRRPVLVIRRHNPALDLDRQVTARVMAEMRERVDAAIAQAFGIPARFLTGMPGDSIFARVQYAQRYNELMMTVAPITITRLSIDEVYVDGQRVA